MPRVDFPPGEVAGRRGVSIGRSPILAAGPVSGPGGASRERDGALAQPGSRVTSISVVIPAYNEERIVASTVEAAVAALVDLTDDFEGIVVNDGSSDATPRIVEGRHAVNPRVRLVSHAVNQGYGATLATGFAAATRDYIFLTDGDRQFDVRELGGFLPLLASTDLVVGYRRPRADPWVRRFYGW